MASEGSSNFPSEDAEAKKDEESAKKYTSIVEGTSNINTSEIDDDKGDDQLVIDEPEEKSDGESDEKEFEPTIDMMMNDFDDEQTMEEEEALDQENEEDELAALEQEGDMPIEELLKMYGAGRSSPSGEQEESKEKSEDVLEHNAKEVTKDQIKDESNSNVEKMDMASESNMNDEAIIDKDDPSGSSSKRRGSDSPQPPSKKSRSELARFYEAAVEGRALRSQGQPDEMEEEEPYEEGEDSDVEKQDYSWKKAIMIGQSYQASVPSDLAAYGDTLPYENEDKLLWHPGQLESKDVENYLSKSQEAVQTGGVGSLPLGAHVRDDEQALYLLLQCGYSSEEALRRRRMNAIPTADTMTLWSEEECRAFELGLRLYGKDFHMIQSQKVRTRSVGELVQFYYLWKKTERHDVFANNTRLEKKKYTLHPGTTDYMDRFIDEQDPSRENRSSSPNFYSLMFGGQEGRKGLTLHPGVKSNISHGDSNGADTDNTANVPTSSIMSSNTLGSMNTSTTTSSSSSTNGRINDISSQPQQSANE